MSIKVEKTEDGLEVTIVLKDWGHWLAEVQQFFKLLPVDVVDDEESGEPG